MENFQTTRLRQRLSLFFYFIILLSMVQFSTCVNEPDDNLLDEFQRYRESKLLYSNAEGIHLLDLKTRKNTILAKNGEVMDYYPYGTGYLRSFADAARWSPDGKMIVYVEEDGGTDYSQITIMDEDGKNKRIIVSEGIPFEPSWSPDGLEIVYTKSLAKFRSNPEVFLINADGTNERQLTNLPGDVSLPGFSRDGQKIIFSSEVTDTVYNRQLYIMNRDGSNIEQLTYPNELFTDAGGASWSPVTDVIAFSGKDGKEPDYEIYLLILSNNQILKLTNKDVIDLNLWNDNVFVKWSNGGGFIMYTQYTNELASDSHPSPSIWGMKSDGSEQQQIISNAQKADLFNKK